MNDEIDELQVKRIKKFRLYFRITCIAWLVIVCFVLAPLEDLIMLSIPFAYLMIGVLIGFFGKKLLLHHPWLLFLLPVLYVLFAVLGLFSEY